MEENTPSQARIHCKHILIFKKVLNQVMSTLIIKNAIKTTFILLVVVTATSCKDYLNIDGYFDDEFNIDSAFANRRNMEAYMWGAAAMFPDESNTVRFGYTPGPMATDEGFNGLTGGGPANDYYGMEYVTGNINPDFFGAGCLGDNYNLNQWARYYKIIRKCNSILANLDVPRDLSTADRHRIEGFTRFIRAYAYYNILVDYGPAILLGDEIVNTNEPIEYYDRPRATYDETMEYTVEEFEKAATFLPAEVS